MANEIIPDSSPNPESALGYDGTDFRTLGVDADGHPQVDVLSYVLYDTCKDGANRPFCGCA